MHDYSKRVTTASSAMALLFRVLLICAVGMVLTACAVPPRQADRRPNGEIAAVRDNNKAGLLPSMSASASGPAKLTQLDLQRELFTFVDRYMERVAQAADEGVAAASDAQARANLQATKVMYVSSAVAIASEPVPLNALRDLIVMVSLQRMVWEAGGGPQVDQREANRVALALRLLELQILALAERFIPANSIRTLQALILDWRRANSQQHYVAFVRFHDLGASEGASSVDRALSSGGLLARVEAVARDESSALLTDSVVSFAVPLSQGSSSTCAVPFKNVLDACGDPVQTAISNGCPPGKEPYTHSPTQGATVRTCVDKCGPGQVRDPNNFRWCAAASASAAASAPAK